MFWFANRNRCQCSRGKWPAYLRFWAMVFSVVRVLSVKDCKVRVSLTVLSEKYTFLNYSNDSKYDARDHVRKPIMYAHYVLQYSILWGLTHSFRQKNLFSISMYSIHFYAYKRITGHSYNRFPHLYTSLYLGVIHYLPIIWIIIFSIFLFSNFLFNLISNTWILR